MYGFVLIYGHKKSLPMSLDTDRLLKNELKSFPSPHA